MTFTSNLNKSAAILFLAFCSLSISAQPKATIKVQDIKLGDIAWNIPALARFELENTGNKPLQIQEVRTDCGCTTVNWNNCPIAPGASSTLTVSYDANTLGTFHKNISITTTASIVPLRLTLQGRVLREVVDYDKDFPIHIGDIRLSTDNLEFDDVNRGEQPQATLYLFNAGKKDYSPELMHLPKYLSAYADPEVIRPGRMGKLIITLNSNEVRSFGLTQTNIYLSRFSGDRVGTDNELGTAVTLLPHFSESEQRNPAAPKADIPTSIDLGSFGTKQELKGALLLTNRGQSPLKVSMLQVYKRGISVSLSKGTLKPGASAKLRVTVSQSSEAERGNPRILLITNDPQLPKITIEVKTKK
mgnify:FL=1